MPHITFLDIEVQPRTGKILDIGAISDAGEILHTSSLLELKEFIRNSKYLCGHNIIGHDIAYLKKSFGEDFFTGYRIIDTLYLSPLLFPQKPYHRLVKDDKLQTEDINNPLNDAKKAKDLFYDEVTAFKSIATPVKEILCSLLNDKKYFRDFFHYLQYFGANKKLSDQIFTHFGDQICNNVEIESIANESPVELAYTVALIECDNSHSITPPWVLKVFPAVERIMFLLRSNPCVQRCQYCNKSFDAVLGLKTYFGFDAYRKFDNEPLQERAVEAAINNKSILAVFPTGGGKSLTFQIPALMAGANAHALTVVISPLQSLMKDQVDNLEKKGITDAVTINGLLNPIDRGKSVTRVEEGTASILYISPESLRSKTIEKLLLGRKIARFVIDEAHCFSSWGHDFRVDYLYIGDFIENFQIKKNLSEPIPVSCFTATAKPQVIDDIRRYFIDKLDLGLELFSAPTARKNLKFRVINCTDDKEKYLHLRELIDIGECPTIVYVSRTKRAELIAEKLLSDGYSALAYHGKMDAEVKTSNQNDFMAGEVDVIVATSAFGMGVDKDNVGLVVHFEISDSLENYVQEAGRAGRKEELLAECYILFNEDDLGKHFLLLNQTKIDKKQVQEVWKAIKGLTKSHSKMSNSALEIARKAGWNDQVDDIETRVKTAISALEESGYVKRIHNSPQIFATSILSKNAEEAIEKIQHSDRFNDKQKHHAIRVIKKLISSKSRHEASDEVAESRVDYISDHLGIAQRDVIRSISLMREEKILADTKDLSAHIQKGNTKSGSLSILQRNMAVEKAMLNYLEEGSNYFHIKEINSHLLNQGIESNPNLIKAILNFWQIRTWIRREKSKGSSDHLIVVLKRKKEGLEPEIEKRHVLAGFIVNFLFGKISHEQNSYQQDNVSSHVEFSVHELKDEYFKANSLFEYKVSVADVESTLFYLSRIEALNIDGGFLVIYNRLNIDRIEQNQRKQYKEEDYDALKTHYDHKIQQIHIVGEYAKKMVADYSGAMTFVEDYFQLNYSSFLKKYFPGSKKDEIAKSITPAKFRQLFGELSLRQLDIVKDKDSQYIQVAAGPGSGKTKLLVHKLASILYMEDVKHEQLLMLTFSRAAVTEFKSRLIKLIGNAALYVEIKTFHSYCFDLLGRMGSIESSDGIVLKAVEKIRNGEVEIGKISKAVLVIDEAQDMDSDENELIKSLMEQNPEMRVIAVGDDDQNIYEFRGSDSKYFQGIGKLENSKFYELVENFRSKSNLVDFTNQFANRIQNRIKTTDINPIDKRAGSIRVLRYESEELISPFVNNFSKQELIGSTCILTFRNDDALHIHAMLTRDKIKSKLIQSNSGFSLLKLMEIRTLLESLKGDGLITISKEALGQSVQLVKEKYKNDPVSSICNGVLKGFEQSYPKTKYFSDLEAYIGESKAEDFIDAGSDTVIVSTMHKAKGSEFDNIFILLNHFSIKNDENRRLLYVALTRAKNNLSIYYKDSYLDDIQVNNIERYEVSGSFDPPTQIALQLAHKDLNLGYFSFVQRRIKRLESGDPLKVNDEGLLNENDEFVAKFSQKFMQGIQTLRNRGYEVVSAKVNFLVYWYNQDKEEENLMPLPELVLSRILGDFCKISHSEKLD